MFLVPSLGRATRIIGARPSRSRFVAARFTLFSSLISSPHVELTMAPHAGFDTDQIRDKARKDLLYLLEGVSKAALTALRSTRHRLTHLRTGTGQEESGA